MMKEKRKEFEDLFDKRYIGNIFGLRLTFIGLAIVLFFTGLAVYRHITLGVSFTGNKTESLQDIQADEVETKDTLNDGSSF